MATIDYKKIDEEFREIIKILNKKEYKTLYCCQGHKHEIKKPTSRMSAYLVFEHAYDFPIPIPTFDFIYIPKKNKKPQKDPYTEICNGTTFYWFTRAKGSYEEKEKDRKDIMSRLLQWSKDLPKREKKNIYTYNTFAYGKRGGEYYLSATYNKKEAFNKLKKFADNDKYVKYKIVKTLEKRY